MWKYYYDLVGDKRANPQDDMMTRLTEVEAERENGTSTRLDDVEIAAFASLLGGAGAETVTKLIGSAAVVFARHQDQWQALRKDRSLIPAAFEELLRYEGPSQYDIRWSNVDVELHGQVIPKHRPVMLINWFGHEGRASLPRSGSLRHHSGALRPQPRLRIRGS